MFTENKNVEATDLGGGVTRKYLILQQESDDSGASSSEGGCRCKTFPSAPADWLYRVWTPDLSGGGL